MFDRMDVCGCGEVDASDLLTVESAVRLALSDVQPIDETRIVALSDAIGQTIAADIHAAHAMPFFDNSAMDGFALRLSDLDDDLSLPVAGTVCAGDAPCSLPPGRALRIFTGAPLPVGADTVVMVEKTRQEGACILLDARPAPGANIRRKGSDQAAQDVLVRVGTKIGARHIGLLAANGVSTVKVRRKPRIGVFSTGDELVPGDPGGKAGQIPDANRSMLLSLAAAAGADVSDLGILPDCATATAEALVGLENRFDLILTSGAVSLGGKDHVRDALVAAGGTIQGWRVALKPGKPVMFGRLGKCLVTGLPGNPFAAFVGFHLFAGSQIAALSGQAVEDFAQVPAKSGFDWSRKPGRSEVFPVRLLGYDAAGCAILDRLGRGVSATLLPLSEADGLAMVSADTAQIAPSDRLTWHPLKYSGDLQ